ncbi:MAG: phage tail protein [Sulfurifustis sp.]
MTGPVDPRIGAQLYALLPEVYRERDKSGDLAKYLDACGEMLDRVYATLRQRLDDHFPDTCQEWLIPYFAELLDVALKSPEASGRRAEVANAIAWRQRKGTAGCTEEIAEAVGAMEVELQEAWRRVARTARIGEKLLPAALLGGTRDPDTRDPLTAGQHPDLPVVTIDFRRHSRAMQAHEPSLITHRTRFPKKAAPVLWFQANPHGAPCFPGSYEDRSARTVDFRTPDWARGHFHPKRLLAFIAPPDGFFPEGAPSFRWTERAQAITDGLLEEIDETETRDGVLIRRTIYRRPDAQPATIRIRDVIDIDDPVVAGEERVYRFEGFYLADTLTVHGGRLELERCAAFKIVVQGHDTHHPVLTATDCLLRHVQAASGLAQLECCTVLAKTVCEALQAVDCLFLGDLQRNVTPTTPPPKIICLRHVRVPPELLTNVAAGERNRIQRYTTDVPVFFRLGFGVAGAGVLHPATPDSIRAGAEDGGELGAYHHQHLSLRETAVREKLAEYLPFGMEAVLISDERLTCAPPK